MPTPCNIRYRQLKQLEAEFAAMSRDDLARVKELAASIVSLSAEFNLRNMECERWLVEQP